MNCGPTASLPHVLVFEIGSPRGHATHYVRVLAEYWCKHPTGRLTFVVLPALLTALGGLAEQAVARGIRFVCLSPHEVQTKIELERTNPSTPFSELASKGERSQFALYYDWELLQAYAARLAATECFCPRLDGYLPLIAAGVSMPIPLSGILFDRWVSPAAGVSEEARVARLRQRFILARALRQDQLKRLFVLDYAAALEAARLFTEKKVEYLADPVTVVDVDAAAVDRLRQRHGIAPDRTVALLFGDLTERKGVLPLLEAVERLPAELSDRLSLLLVGEIRPALLARATPLFERLQRCSKVQLVVTNAYVAQSDIPAYFKLANVVLMPYLSHAGMSGVLLWAAAAERPVIASDFGLIGELVREHQLGILVESGSRTDIAEALIRSLQESGSHLFSPMSARAFVRQHDSCHFAQTVLGSMPSADPVSADQ